MSTIETTATEQEAPTPAERFVTTITDHEEREAAYRDAMSELSGHMIAAVERDTQIAAALLTIGAPYFGATWQAPYGATRQQLLEWLTAAQSVFEWIADLPGFKMTAPIKPAIRYDGERLQATITHGSTAFNLAAAYTPNDTCRVVPTGEKRVETIEVTKTECVPGAETGAAWEALGLSAPAVLDESTLAAA